MEYPFRRIRQQRSISSLCAKKRSSRLGREKVDVEALLLLIEMGQTITGADPEASVLIFDDGFDGVVGQSGIGVVALQ